MESNRSFQFASRGRVGPSWSHWYGLQIVLLSMWSVPILLLLVLPIATLMGKSLFLDFRLAGIAAEQVRQALVLSLQTSAVATILTVGLGTPLAFLMAKGPIPAWISRGMSVLVELPLILPPVVAGVALLLVFGRQGWFGQWLHTLGTPIAFTPAAVILAQLFVASPFYIRSAVVGLENIDSEIENASALDGASFAQMLRLITLPLSRNALFTGGIMTWARALGEFGATLIFAGNFPGRTQTMPMVIYLGFDIDMAISLTLAGILLLVALVVLSLARLVQYRWLRVM